MGGTLPVLSKYFVRNMKSIGWNLGLIYSINTFGALVGCFLVGFVLIRAVGVKGTLYGGVACNVFVALCAIILSLREKESSYAAETAQAAAETDLPEELASHRLLSHLPFPDSPLCHMSFCGHASWFTFWECKRTPTPSC
jgi:spermidine synthase